MAEKQGPEVVMTSDPEPRGGAEGASWLAVFRAPEWGLAAGIVAVLGVIFMVDPSRNFFSVGSSVWFSLSGVSAIQRKS